MRDKEEKAELGYRSHFLANRRTDGILDGAMARLKFVNIQNMEERGELIGLTSEGLEFTKLKNPILDESLYSEQTLSEIETDSYIRHITNNVREELNPFSIILQIIKNGATAVTDIDGELKKIKPNWIDIVIVTQRVEALGRMNELGLLDKTKKGIRVNVQISEKGKIFLNNL